MSKILLEMIRNIVNDLSLSNHKLNQESIDKIMPKYQKINNQNTRKLIQKLFVCQDTRVLKIDQESYLLHIS